MDEQRPMMAAMKAEPKNRAKSTAAMIRQPLLSPSLFCFSISFAGGESSTFASCGRRVGGIELFEGHTREAESSSLFDSTDQMAAAAESSLPKFPNGRGGSMDAASGNVPGFSFYEGDSLIFRSLAECQGGNATLAVFDAKRIHKNALRNGIALNDGECARQGGDAKGTGLGISRAIRVCKAVAHENNSAELAIIARAVDGDLERFLAVFCLNRDGVRIDLLSCISANVLIQELQEYRKR